MHQAGPLLSLQQGSPCDHQRSRRPPVVEESGHFGVSLCLLKQKTAGRRVSLGVTAVAT